MNSHDRFLFIIPCKVEKQRTDVSNTNHLRCILINLLKKYQNYFYSNVESLRHALNIIVFLILYLNLKTSALFTTLLTFWRLLVLNDQWKYSSICATCALSQQLKRRLSFRPPTSRWSQRNSPDCVSETSKKEERTDLGQRVSDKSVNGTTTKTGHNTSSLLQPQSFHNAMLWSTSNHATAHLACRSCTETSSQLSVCSCLTLHYGTNVCFARKVEVKFK